MEDTLNQKEQIQAKKNYMKEKLHLKKKLLDIALCSCFWGVVYATLGEKNKEQKNWKNA